MRLPLYAKWFVFADARILFYMLKNAGNAAPCSKSLCCTSAVQCVCACVFVYAVRQGCVLCKSLAGASSQPGGQTRKQMDWFGLNPSHAILSSWPSSFPCPSSLLPLSLLIQPARHALQNESRAATECCAAPGGRGAVSHAISPSQRRPQDRE